MQRKKQLLALQAVERGVALAGKWQPQVHSMVVRLCHSVLSPPPANGHAKVRMPCEVLWKRKQPPASPPPPLLPSPLLPALAHPQNAKSDFYLEFSGSDIPPPVRANGYARVRSLFELLLEKNSDPHSSSLCACSPSFENVTLQCT